MNRENKRFTLKIAALIMALALVLVGVIGTTLAWLIDETDPVKNIFTVGKVEITLEETDPEGDDPLNNEYTMVPGTDIEKDPLITVKANSENCWLFVKIDESANLNDFITYDVILDDPSTTAVEGWTALDGVDGVYYIEVTKSEVDQEYGVLVGDKVKVNEDVTTEDLEALTENTYPSLTFTAYAVQRGENAAINTAAAAWQLAVDAQANG